MLPRVHALPRELTFRSDGGPEGSVNEATLHLVPRVVGDVYEVSEFDRDLLTIQEITGSKNQEWAIQVTGYNPAITRTRIMLISSSEYYLEVPVVFHW